MATKKELHQMLGKALADPAFRKEALEDPAVAAKGMGIELTPEQVEEIEKIDVTKVVEAVEETESKGCGYHIY